MQKQKRVEQEKKSVHERADCSIALGNPVQIWAQEQATEER